MAAKGLWDNMFQATDNKSVNWDAESPIVCPSEENPFLRTNGNINKNKNNNNNDLYNNDKGDAVSDAMPSGHASMASTVHGDEENAGYDKEVKEKDEEEKLGKE